MFLNNKFRNGYSLPYGGLIFWLCLNFALVIFSSSCKKNQTAGSDGFSSEFNSINDTVAQLNATKREKDAIIYLDSKYNKINNPTLSDKIQYYRFHFMYSKKVSRDRKQEMLYTDSMIMVANKFTNLKQYVYNYADANFAKGDAYFDLNQYTSAYRYYYEGYILGKNYIDNSLLAEYTYRMGMVSFRQSHYKLAINYFKESFAQSSAYHNDFRAFYQRQELLNDIGESYMNIGNTDSANLYFNKALAYIDKYSVRFKDLSYKLDIARAVTWGDQGKLMYNIGNYTAAQQLFQKSISYNLRKSYDNYDAELVEVDLADLYLKQHQLIPLLSLLQNLHTQLAITKNLEALAAWNRLMSAYYTENKDYARSLDYFKGYSTLKDSLSKLDLFIKEANFNQQLANYDNQYQIQVLKDNNSLQKFFLYLAVLAVIMAIVILMLVIRNWGRSKSDVAAISKLNDQISSQKNDLEATLIELNTNSQEKDRILRTVAHDLRNPVGGIVSLTNIMLQDDYTEDQKELISLVNSTSNNTLELINEILEATNNKIGRANKQLVEINALVNNSAEIMSFKAAEKGQKIITTLLDAPQILSLSRERIWRVISNLISNAIKFSPRGTEIKVVLTETEKQIQILVADNGIGIPDNLKNDVFNIFTDAKRPGTAGEKSFGLGLSICQQIIENHDGKIWFESEMNKGTTFYVTLNKPIF